MSRMLKILISYNLYNKHARISDGGEVHMQTQKRRKNVAEIWIALR